MTTRRGWIVAARVAAVVAALLLVACDSSSGPRLRHLTGTQDYLPGVAADVFLPHRTAVDPPVVVLVPGGAWRSADRSGLRPLADTLAGRGIAAFTATYRIGSADARFPVPVADIVCAVDFAVDRVRRAGMHPGPVALLGHSSGAQLAALAALEPARFRSGCPYPSARIDGFIGLAGAYDPIAFEADAQALFGVPSGADPQLWHSGDPSLQAAHRPSLHVLLLHGADDTTVPSRFSSEFADALRAAGHRVELRIVPGADHATIYQPAASAEFILRWLDAGI